jgi:peptide/nickel transport system substrate-binding protein
VGTLQRPRGVRLLVLSAVLALAAAACGGEKTEGGTAGGTQQGGTVVFAASADPVSLDPAVVSDGESIRIANQIYEGLVKTKAGGTEIEPSLAKSWTSTEDAKSWTFELQTGVKFHDGTAFNAAAVCANFERWYNWKGLLQSDAVTYYYVTFFRGFSDKKTPSLYQSCEAQDEDTVTINLTEPSASFLAAMSQASFSMQSPEALKKYGADKVSGSAEAPKFDGTYGKEHPTGTGALKFESYTAQDKVTLVRNDDYWGQKAILDKVIFRTIADLAARRQALEAGEIQGYDNADPGDVEALKANYQVLQRPAFNVAYVGFNQEQKPLDNPKIRQAIAYALNRDALIKAKYPVGSEVANEFMPPELQGYNENVTKYEYNVDKAKQLIAESGVSNPTLEFWYPTAVSRPYMPDPAANFQAFKADLEKAGFKVTPKSAPWSPDYLNAIQGGQAPVYLFGWTGDFGDADNFLGTFFQGFSEQWGFRNQEIFTTLTNAERETDPAKRVELYKQANEQVMQFLPGVPYAHTGPFLVLTKNVQGYVPSPVTTELFSTVSLTSTS